MHQRLCRRICCWGAAAALAIAGPPLQAQATSDAALIKKADGAVRRGDYTAGYSYAERAIAADSTDFQGYYYAAYALYKQGLTTQALPLVEHAFGLAPAQSQGDVQELMVAVRGRDAYLAHLHAGDSASAAGLFGQAAAEYAKAWEAMPTDQALGIKAARLYGDRLGDYANAVRILRSVQEHPASADRSQDAQRLLRQYNPHLNDLYWERVERANTLLADSRDSDAIALLAEAANMIPDEGYAHIRLAQIYAKRHAEDDLFRELGLAVRDRTVTIDTLLKTVDADAFDWAVADPRFLQFVQDALGPEAHHQAEAFVADKRAALTSYVGSWVPTDPGTDVRLLESAGGIRIGITSDLGLTATGAFHVKTRWSDETRALDGAITAIKRVSANHYNFERGRVAKECSGSDEDQQCWVLEGEFQFVQTDPGLLPGVHSHLRTTVHQVIVNAFTDSNGHPVLRLGFVAYNNDGEWWQDFDFTR